MCMSLSVCVLGGSFNNRPSLPFSVLILIVFVTLLSNLCKTFQQFFSLSIGEIFKIVFLLSLL